MRLHPILGCKRRLSAMQHLLGEHRAIARNSERCEGEKGMRGTRRSKERTGQGLWARPGAKLTGASRRSCWTKLSKRTCEPFFDRGRQKHLWRDPGSGLAEAYLREGVPMGERVPK